MSHASVLNFRLGARATNPPSRFVVVLLAVTAMILALVTPSVAFADTAATELRVACAQKSNGLMRAAATASDCRPKQETAVTIWPGPTSLCIQPDGSVRRYTSAKACMGAKPAGAVLVVPTTNGQPVFFCAPSSGVLRRVAASTECLAGEQRYVIGNHDPSDLTLSNADVLENEPAGTTVGTLGLVDPDPAATPAFALVSGTGDADNASFTITGTTLKTAASFDFETKASYSIRVRGTDGYGGAREEVFTVSVLDVVEDVPPTAVDDAANVTEDSAASTLDLLANDTDPDGGPISISQVSQPAHGTVVLAADAASVTYQPDADSCNAPPGTVTDDFTYTLAPGGSTATVSVTVACVDDAPIAVNDDATFDEDAPATAIDVLANDTDVDGGPISIANVTQPGIGTVVITGGGTGLTYDSPPGYCNLPSGDGPDTFTYTLAPGGSTALVSVQVTCEADAPVADDETFDGADSAIGNTVLVIDDPTDGPPAVAGPHLTITGDLLDGDTDQDPGTVLAIVPGTFATEQGGSVTIEADGDVVYTPPAGCTTVSDGFDYTLTDQGPVVPLTDTGHVTIAIADCVWYVDNDAPGDSGTSAEPFDTLAQAAAASADGDDVFVFAGDGTTTGYADGIVLDDDQQLIGEASDLVVGGRTLHTGDPAKRPTITTTAAGGTYVVGLGVGNRIAGLEVHPVTVAGGIGVVDYNADPAGDVTIDDVRIIDTVAGGIGLALQGATGTNTIGDLEVDVTGFGVLVDDTAKVVFDPAATVQIRTTGTGWALLAQGTNLEGSQIDRVVVDGGTGGTGGIFLQQTTGAVAFGDLDLRTTNSSQAVFSLNLTGPVTVPASATAKIVATNGPAVQVVASAGSSLSFDEVTATKSNVFGINIDQIGAGSFSAASGELSGGAFGLTQIRVVGGSGDISYGGSINDGPATNSVEILNRTGGTVTLSGSITDGSDAGGGVRVVGNTGGATVLSGASKHLETGTSTGIEFGASGGHRLSITGGGLDVATTSGGALDAHTSGTIVVTGTGNRLASTTGVALSISGTSIGADDVTFERISANGAPSGIRLVSTGSAGGLHVTGGGSAAQGGDASGGTIAAATNHAIDLSGTADVSLRNMRIVNPAGNGISGADVAGFTFRDGTITGAGDADGEDGIAFDGSALSNLSGTVDISNNVLELNEASGVSIANRGGTIPLVTISGNRISDAGDLLTPGSAIVLSATGSATGAATITKATIASNTITDFRAGYGIRLLGGNTAGTAKSTLGVPNSDQDFVAVVGNRMDGGDGGVGQQPDGFVDIQVSGGADANLAVSRNGEVGDPIRHVDCQAIGLTAAGQANVTAVIAVNKIAAGSASGCAGIAATASTLGSASAKLALVVANNEISAAGGPGIAVEAADSGIVTAQVVFNTVAAPTGPGLAGIRASSGSPFGGDAALCLAITNNVTTGSLDPGFGFTAPGIQLSKITTDPAINVFGIQGLPAGQTASPAVEASVNSLNPGSAPGTIGVGGTLLSPAKSGFTPCTIVE
ncbi:beta strand repeat-containing protein [Agromyces sp. M3QZ16-3]|uniref:beta strand repeat-containing protein n=1 Tax=Agromyces sp. M3QZ16-3 TaxID=3447585 RepID=UPI003F68E42F